MDCDSSSFKSANKCSKSLAQLLVHLQHLMLVDPSADHELLLDVSQAWFSRIPLLRRVDTLSQMTTSPWALMPPSKGLVLVLPQ